MITAEEALNTVRRRGHLTPMLDNYSLISLINRGIIDHVNQGWLGMNLVPYLQGKYNSLELESYYKNLGFKIDFHDRIIHWMYG